MFGSCGYLLPGNEMRSFAVLATQTEETSLGRVLTGGFLQLGRIDAILAQARQDEWEHWHQSGHPITHKIISQGAVEFEVTAGDVLELDGRRFYIQGINNPAQLDHWVIFYCEERPDIT